MKLGLDMGSSYTKGVLVDDDNSIANRFSTKTAHSFEKAARKVMDHLSAKSNIDSPIYTCGYGREQLDEKSEPCSEISALATGIFETIGRECSVVDIGGQDTKFIQLGSGGKIENFTINRKCAAGTGSFLEEIARKLDIPPAEFNDHAKKAENNIRLNSYCSVFAATEITGMIKEGIKLPDIAKSVYLSIIERVMELGELKDLTVLTGGIPAFHPVLIDLLEEQTPSVTSPEYPQHTAAFGAVLQSERT